MARSENPWYSRLVLAVNVGGKVLLRKARGRMGEGGRAREGEWEREREQERGRRFGKKERAPV